MSSVFIGAVNRKRTRNTIKVFRGVGNNISESENQEILWVAESVDVAKNYAKSGLAENIRVMTIKKPSNPIEFPYPLDRPTEVRGSDLANNFRKVAAGLYKRGVLPKENVSKAYALIRDFEDKAGERIELFLTKINKPYANEAFSKMAQALGFDAVVQKESASRTGTPTNTYGLFKRRHKSLLKNQ